MNKIRISKNEPCPCGSGVVYKNCCYKKKDSEMDTTHTKKVLLDISRKFDSMKFKECLHPCKGECKPPIKAAHSIQNHGVLSLISKKNHVIAFPTEKTNPASLLIDSNGLYFRKLELVGVNDATKHTCFCNYHDSKVFSPIENNLNGFLKSDIEQIFLYAYKAFSFEYYKSKVALLGMQELFKMLPHKLTTYPFLYIPHYREAQKKDIEMKYYKEYFDEALMSKNYDDLYTEIIEIPYKIEFATIDCISPSFNILGEKVKQFDKGQMRRMFLNIFPNKNSSFIILSCIKSDVNHFKKFIDTIKAAEFSLVQNFLSMFIPIYSESMVINPLLWETWGTQGQLAFTHLCNLMGKDAIRMEIQLANTMMAHNKLNVQLKGCKCDLFTRI
ncbi:MAG: SEC-C metal-binding domain-containing protein [Eubacteriales bacterium]